MTSRDELTGLTALRFFAAMFVLLFHARFFAEGGWLEIPIYALFSSGALGVDIFFVLSGFVLSYVYSNKLNYKEYLIRRIARIYPVYLITTLAAMLCIWWLGATPRYTFSGLDAVLNLLMLQSWFGGRHVSINFVSWTVSAEFAVYLLLPLIFWILRFLPINFIGVILPIVLYAVFGGLELVGLNSAVNKCLFEFSTGVMLCKYWSLHGRFPVWLGKVALISALLLLCAQPWLEYLNLPFHAQYLSILTVPIVAWCVTWTPKNELLIFGGRASYAIYLVHGVIFIILRRCVELNLLSDSMALPLFLLLSITVALAVYLWIEGPARGWLARKLSFVT